MRTVLSVAAATLLLAAVAYGGQGNSAVKPEPGRGVEGEPGLGGGQDRGPHRGHQQGDGQARRRKKREVLGNGQKLHGQEGRAAQGIQLDSLHLTSRGYEIWAEAILPTLRDLLK